MSTLKHLLSNARYGPIGTNRKGTRLFLRQVLSDLKDRLINTFGAGPNYFVVRNLGRATDFSLLDASPALLRARALGAQVFDLDALHETSMRKIDGHNASFWAAVNSRTGPDSLGMLERQRVRIWLRNTYASLDRLPL